MACGLVQFGSQPFNVSLLAAAVLCITCESCYNTAQFRAVLVMVCHGRASTSCNVNYKLR